MSLMGLCSSSSAVLALAAADKEFVAKHVGAQKSVLDGLRLSFEDGAKLFEAFEKMDSSCGGTIDFNEFCDVRLLHHALHPRALECAPTAVP